MHLIAVRPGVTINGFQSDLDFTEVVYLVGGAKDDVSGDDCTSASGSNFPLSVVRMIDPDVDAEWSDADDNEENGHDNDAPELNMARAFHNTVILLDGSILAVGGVQAYGGSCSPRYLAELLRPEEVFHSTNPQWEYMAEQEDKRSYHSIACLLPDGSVISAGGFDKTDYALNTEHSLEVFRPPYLYQTARPAIVLADVNPTATTAYDYGDTLEFDVTVADAGTTIERVALLRPSAVTHSTDMGQSYVGLKFAEPVSSVSTRRRTVKVLLPIDGFYAAPGYHMLTVIDNEGVPSEAVWIRLNVQ